MDGSDTDMNTNEAKRVFFGYCIADGADEDDFIELWSQILPPKILLKTKKAAGASPTKSPPTKAATPPPAEDTDA